MLTHLTGPFQTSSLVLQQGNVSSIHTQKDCLGTKKALAVSSAGRWGLQEGWVPHTHTHTCTHALSRSANFSFPLVFSRQRGGECFSSLWSCRGLATYIQNLFYFSFLKRQEFESHVKVAPLPSTHIVLTQSRGAQGRAPGTLRCSALSGGRRSPRHRETSLSPEKRGQSTRDRKHLWALSACSLVAGWRERNAADSYSSKMDW